MIETKQAYDVVVIGCGGGGLRSAIGAAQKGARTLVIGAGKVNRSGATLLAGANISADVACDGASLARLGISDSNKNDTKEAWFEDVVHEGFYLNNQKLLELFVNTASDRLEELMQWGMKIRGMEGDREISVFGSDILDALYTRAKELHVDFVGDNMFCDLVVERGTVCGVVCLDLISGQLHHYPARAVILATGGAHNLFPSNSGSTELCGSGQAAALRAGAELTDMEMISFCPTVMTNPVMYKGNILPYILFSTGYGRLLNKYGKTFTHRYLSAHVEQLALDTEWNKMLLSYALQSEILNGRGNMHGGIYYTLDLHPTDLQDELYADLPPLKTGIYADIMKIFAGDRAVTVQPAAHYFEGGVRVNDKMETCVPGLYAAGECTGGLFGANRVSAATTEMLVEGARAGDSAGLYAREADWIQASPDTLAFLEEELLRPLERNDGVRPQDALDQLHHIVGDALTVIRSRERLNQGMRLLDEFMSTNLPNLFCQDKSRVYNRQLRESIQLRDMALVAQAILLSADARKESRGVHVRSDYLVTDNCNLIKNTVVDPKTLQVRLEDTVLTRMEPEKVKLSYVDYIEQIVGQLQ